MPNVPERGYPLSALFILVAACAIPMAMAAAAGRAMSRGEADGFAFAVAAMVGCAGTMFLGSIIGLHHHRQGIGIIVGGMAGAIVGSMAGPIVLAAPEDFARLMVLAVGGSIVMVAIAAAFRQSAQRRRQAEPPGWFNASGPFQQS
jgi:hypothetical protein